MKRSFGLNLLYTVLILIVLAVAGFIGYFITALTLGLAFYAPLIVVVACGLAAYFVMTVFQLLSPGPGIWALLFLPGFACWLQPDTS
ncbi:hypothetical protein [Paenibacillus sonchi]|uniref:hypothetical protein n=1 Tax=Paenibacillus sonchi TaxID=373687 RepID=UPI001F409197|nr:hypothetical protein [Paenibacillus sonchi]